MTSADHSDNLSAPQSNSGLNNLPISSDIGIRLNEFNLLIIDKSIREVGNKIAYNYHDAKVRISHALAMGKTVIFLPGTYDLLHAGHVVWFDQALLRIQAYLKTSRENLFVVVPYDNDKLTRIIKREKHVNLGGSEIYLRPIINEKNRGLALANLPHTDLVMAIPSPYDLENVLVSDGHLDLNKAKRLLNKSRVVGRITKKDYKELKQVLETYQKMVTNKDLQATKDAFASHYLSDDTIDEIKSKLSIDNKLWGNAAWQLMCYLYKMEQDCFDQQGKKKHKVYRVISRHDDYTPQIELVMRLAGVRVLVIEEDYITSTTNIIRENNTKNQLDDLAMSMDSKNYLFS